jgi:folate/biopterin transporter
MIRGKSVISGIKSKWGYMISVFGYNTLLILFFVYWSQGFKSVSSLAITLYYKETLFLSPSATQFIRTMTSIAWFIKPIYGLITDNFPICGYHRKFYLLISGIAGILCMISISMHENLYFSILALILNEFSGAFSDVIADAIMVEKSRNDPAGSSALQSFSWTMMGVGGIIGSLLGGVLLEQFAPKYIISLTALSSLFLIFAAIKVKENPQTKKPILDNIYLLLKAILNPEILKPLIFVLLLNGISPRYSDLTIYYLTDVLKFHPSFISSLSIITYITLILGGSFYHSFLKNIEYRDIIALAQVLLAATGLIDLCLVTGFYKELGIPAWVFVVGDDVIGSSIQFSFKMLPLMVMCAKICPSGIEATFFALFTAVFNIGFALSGLFGSLLMKLFDVNTNQYDLMWVLVLIQSFTKLIPLLFLPLLPRKIKEDEEVIELDLIGNEIID